MKVSLLFLLVTCILSTGVSAEVFIKTTLPNDLPADDFSALQAAGEEWFRNQEEIRNLRGKDRRERGTWCQRECQGWPCGQCFVWLRDCWRNWCTERRSFNEEEADGLSPPPRTREIYTEECVEKIDEALLIMEAAVSADGEPIVDASHFSCYEQIEEVGEPQSCRGFSYWTMWDAVEDEVSIQNFQDNPSICQSQMQDSNLEAVLDITCDVDTVTFVITRDDPGSTSSGDPGSSSSDDPGSSYSYSRTERFYQYLLYGNNDDNMLRSHYSFPVGDYTVTATASLKDGSSTEASLTFKVNDC